MGEQLMATLPLHIKSEGISIATRSAIFPGMIGFYFVFRTCLTFLFFQADPVTGTIVSITAGLALLYGAVLYSSGIASRSYLSPLRIPTIRWIALLLCYSLASVMWTGAQSTINAFIYWVGMMADVAIVLLLMRHGEARSIAESLMKGFVWGAVALSVVAWCSPANAELRLGNDQFLHPNTLGLEIALALLIAQYFAPRGAQWKWLSIALAITLLRTLSKTSIIAFAVAECWFLMCSHTISRKAKVQIGVATLGAIAAFWNLFSSYIEIYNNTASGNQLETLTGRTALWAVAVAMGMEKPWFGHGIYSFKALIPTFGDFEPVHAHNELIQQFFEYGVVGLVIAIGLHWVFYRMAQRAAPGDLRALALTLLFFALVHGLTDTVPFGFSYPLWLMTGLSLCLATPSIREAQR
jgi:exopolysaccharide production protein ExoQ